MVLYLDLDFACRFKEPALLPLYRGSALRGGFGHSLKRISCSLRKQKCSDCLLAATCCYSLVFESESLKNNSGACEERLADRPHPYLFLPSDDQQRAYAVDEPFSFSMRLFGVGIHFMPHIVAAVMQMGQEGIGANRQRKQGRFVVEQAHSFGREIFNHHDQRLANAGEGRPLEPLDPGPVAVTTMKVRLDSPARIKFHNTFQRDLPFHVLTRACLRRIATLETAYGGGEPPLDYKGLVAGALEVETVAASSRWQEMERYSSRQQSAMSLGGVVGEIAFAGKDLAPFVPLFRYCETAHIGKQTTFGLGRIIVAAAG